jgi:DNA-directed RNA polymerase subunit F
MNYSLDETVAYVNTFEWMDARGFLKFKENLMKRTKNQGETHKPQPR